MRTKNRMGIGWFVAIMGLVLAGALPAGAASYIWTNKTSGTYNWSDSANWSNNAAPPSGGGSTVTVQLFTNASTFAAGYAQTNNNDLAGTLTLNAFTVKTSGANANNTAQGGAMNFVANGATLPTATLDVNAGTLRVRNDLVLGNAPLTLTLPQSQNLRVPSSQGA